MKGVEHLCIVYYVVSIINVLWTMRYAQKQYVTVNLWRGIESIE